MNLPTLIEGLKTYCEEFVQTKNNLYLFLIYELICNTYVKAKQEKYELQYDVFANMITFCRFFKYQNYTNAQYQKIKKSGNVFKLNKESAEILTFMLKLPTLEFMTQFIKKPGIKLKEYLKDQYKIIKIDKDFYEIDKFL